MKTIEKSLAVFCLATYGEGDPTDNAMEFWEWIQGDVDLAGLNYAVSEFHIRTLCIAVFFYVFSLLCAILLIKNNTFSVKKRK